MAKSLCERLNDLANKERPGAAATRKLLEDFAEAATAMEQFVQELGDIEQALDAFDDADGRDEKDDARDDLLQTLVSASSLLDEIGGAVFGTKEREYEDVTEPSSESLLIDRTRAALNEILAEAQDALDALDAD